MSYQVDLTTANLYMLNQRNATLHYHTSWRFLKADFKPVNSGSLSCTFIAKHLPEVCFVCASPITTTEASNKTHTANSTAD